MKKILPFLSFILGIVFVASCHKNKNPLFDGANCTGKCFILTGHLLDSATTSGLSDAEIKFYFNDITGTFSSKKIYLGRTLTDPAGNYSFRFDGTRFKNIRGYYYAEAFKDNLFSDPLNNNQLASFDLDSTFYNIPFVQNFSLFRPATLRIKVIASSVTNFQFLTVYSNYGRAGSGVVINGGRSVDTTVTFKTAGDIRTFIQSDAAGNGIRLTKYDTVFIPANTTKEVEVRF